MLHFIVNVLHYTSYQYLLFSFSAKVGICCSKIACIVGPALLFERYVSSQSRPQRYYACSACRSRKECQFFQWADRRKTPKKSLVNYQEQEAMRQQLHKAAFSRQEISFVLYFLVRTKKE